MFSDSPCIPFFDLKRFFATATPRMFDVAVRTNKLDIELDWTDLSRACNDNLFMYVLGKYDWLLPRALLDCWLDPAIGPLGYRRARFEDLLRHVAMCAWRTFYLDDMERVLRETSAHCATDADLIIECAAAICTALHTMPDNAVVSRNAISDALTPIETLRKLMKKQKYRVNYAVLFVGLVAGRVSEDNVRHACFDDSVLATTIIERALRIVQ
jgi:hypothetical protein